MALSKPTYELVHGPDRSHDCLESQRFPLYRDALAAALALDVDRCWRVLKLSGGQAYGAHDVTEKDRGGPDERKRLERERFMAQYKAAVKTGE